VTAPAPGIWIIVCAAAFVGGLGAWVFAAGARAAILGSLSRRWPVARGRITESGVVETSRGARLVVRYAYQVDGTSYTGSTLGFASPGSRWIAMPPRDDMRRAAEQQYAIGREVDVFYWPARASVSALEPGFHRASVTLLALGGLWLGVGAAVFAMAFVRYR